MDPTETRMRSSTDVAGDCRQDLPLLRGAFGAAVDAAPDLIPPITMSAPTTTTTATAAVPPVVTPRRFDADVEFLADLPYDPSVLFFDELLEIDPARSLVRCRMPTDRPMPFVDAQRAHPVLHPRHVAGAVMVHATGMLGFVHAYYLLGLRHSEGWIGYGTHIHRVVFRKLVPPGAPIDATCVATRSRIGAQRHIIRYGFEFRHEGDICYEGDQTAVWMRVSSGNGSHGLNA